MINVSAAKRMLKGVLKTSVRHSVMGISDSRRTVGPVQLSTAIPLPLRCDSGHRRLKSLIMFPRASE